MQGMGGCFSPPGAGPVYGICQCRGFCGGVPRPRARGLFSAVPAGGRVSRPRARAPFWSAKKGRKSRLEPAVLRIPFCPDVYWRSCSPCGACSSERRWTLRLPPSPRFSALACWVDGGLLDKRTTPRRFPWHQRNLERTPRAERSDRTSHPQLSLGAGATVPALQQVCTAQQNANLNQGQRLPDLAAIIIGGRQAKSYYTPC